MTGKNIFRTSILTAILLAIVVFFIPVLHPGTHTAQAAGMSAKMYRSLKLKGNWYEGRHDGYRVRFTTKKVIYYPQAGKKGYFQQIVAVRRINRRIGGYRYKGYMLLLRNKNKMPGSNAYNMKNIMFIPDGQRGKQIDFFNRSWNLRTAVYVAGNSLGRTR